MGDRSEIPFGEQCRFDQNHSRESKAARRGALLTPTKYREQKYSRTYLAILVQRRRAISVRDKLPHASHRWEAAAHQVAQLEDRLRCLCTELRDERIRRTVESARSKEREKLLRYRARKKRAASKLVAKRVRVAIAKELWRQGYRDARKESTITEPDDPWDELLHAGLRLPGTLSGVADRNLQHFKQEIASYVRSGTEPTFSAWSCWALSLPPPATGSRLSQTDYLALRKKLTSLLRGPAA